MRKGDPHAAEACRRPQYHRAYKRPKTSPFWHDQKRALAIYNTDSRCMPELDNKSVDFIVTSPPYWDLKKYEDEEGIGTGQTYDEYLSDLEMCLAECARLIKPGRFAAIVVGTRVGPKDLLHIPSEIIKMASRLGMILKKEFIWSKPLGTQGLWQRGTTISMKKTPYPGHININIQHESILVFQRPGRFRMKKKERLTEDFIKQTAWSVWQLPVSRVKEHPAPFPLELARRLIELYTYAGELILDPFLGAGTSLLAALLTHRRGIGYEINRRYCLLSIERLQPHAIGDSIDESGRGAVPEVKYAVDRNSDRESTKYEQLGLDSDKER